jgi:hypothetical protein
MATKKPEMYKSKAAMKKHEKDEPATKRAAEKKAGVKDKVMPPWLKAKKK